MQSLTTLSRNIPFVQIWLCYRLRIFSSHRHPVEPKLKVEVMHSVKFKLFSKVITTLLKKYMTNMINVTILKKKGCFVIAFGARAPNLAVPQHVTSQGWFAPMASIVI